MRLTRPPARQAPETIIALIDVVFFLLVFFMLIGRMDATAPFEVSPPIATTGSDMPAGGITLSVSAAGDMAVDGTPTTAPLDILLDQIAQAPETLVRINAHHAAELRHILPLIAALEAAGAQDVALVVTPAGL
ncbi:ExbD/TolR family protein [Sulfitobacter geojensis]|uniref:Biopolymer transporter ExbD n=1 Tax=Sulfitobacter geojensis TaxID=1342299 RepID=A0AAE3B6H3_9RHOB|nr:biopolymer transporter ExbD [Sulfitobacter geojensis]KHA50857.1 Biopolymer transport protein ExbD/TolR [Sulfitobacter geojensis]MBM1689867.1 biopolymer transporter ExbD [Sulfitobacter geojensis]MBM1693933.1 biopolymer transporter ExbD [Sulfitobacter geojensis]MBM1706099.1 biopolymer transporter ExbD [Sulfitobacter geojensis]MBM1710157.1 biopolymer transporter ExbD [Sulfitobacter geojensis]